MGGVGARERRAQREAVVHVIDAPRVGDVLDRSKGRLAMAKMWLDRLRRQRGRIEMVDTTLLDEPVARAQQRDFDELGTTGSMSPQQGRQDSEAQEITAAVVEELAGKWSRRC